MTTPSSRAALVVYLLHFDRPVKHARHYIGITSAARLEQRQEEHRSGHGAALTRAAFRARIGWTVAKLWENANFSLERDLKRRGHLHRHCPICRPSGPTEEEARAMIRIPPKNAAAPPLPQESRQLFAATTLDREKEQRGGLDLLSFPCTGQP